MPLSAGHGTTSTEASLSVAPSAGFWKQLSATIATTSWRGLWDRRREVEASIRVTCTALQLPVSPNTKAPRRADAFLTPSGLREVCWHASGWSMHDASCAEFALAWPISARPSPWTMCRSCARAVVAPACCARCSWRGGVTFLTRFCLAGCADFTVSYFHFHFPANKSVQKGEVGLDPRAGYFFQRSSVPPRSPLHYQLENGGANTVLYIALLHIVFSAGGRGTTLGTIIAPPFSS